MNLLLILLYMSVQTIIYDFNDQSSSRDWRVVNDGVMGGLSASQFEINETGNGFFHGHVSLENNGGFASVRHQPARMNLEKETQFSIRIKGDGHAFQLRVKSKLNEYHSYKFVFETTGEWQTISIPFNEMTPTFRGRDLDMPNFNGSSMEEIGFLIANKKNQNFELEIDYIRAL